MKIVITSHGEDRHGELDPRFGRADHFVFYDHSNDIWNCLSNTDDTAAHGSGIKASQALIQSGANVLITGHIGPKAFKVLNAAKIKMYSFGDMSGTVEDALAAFFAGKLTPIVTPNALDMQK